MNKNKLQIFLISVIIGLTAAAVSLAFTGPSAGTPPVPNPSFWIRSGSDVYYNVSGGKVGIGTTGPSYKLDINGDIHTAGQLYGDGAASSYGALSVNGTKNGWSGINFRSGTTNLGTLIVNADYQGFLDNADTAWDWQWQNGILTGGTIPVARITAGTFGSGSYTFPSGNGGLQIAGDSSIIFDSNEFNTKSSTLYIQYHGLPTYVGGNLTVSGQINGSHGQKSCYTSSELGAYQCSSGYYMAGFSGASGDNMAAICCLF